MLISMKIIALKEDLKRDGVECDQGRHGSSISGR